MSPPNGQYSDGELLFSQGFYFIQLLYPLQGPTKEMVQILCATIFS